MAAMQPAKKSDSDHVALYGEVTHDPVYAQRRTSPDRTDLRERTVTRNVRTSTMPGTTAPTASAAHPTTDAQFRAEYAKKGLQPTPLDGAQPSPRHESVPQLTRREQIEYEANTLNDSATTGTTTLAQRRAIRDRFKKKGKAGVSMARMRATTANIGIMSWAGFSWLFFQLPMAVLGLIAMAMALGLEYFVGESIQAQNDPTFLSQVGELVRVAVGKVIKTLDAGAEFLFGFSFSAVPSYVFGAFYMLIIAYGIIVLFTMYLIYTFAFLRPLSGNGAGVKKGALILAVVGYSVPILNLFPWFLAWCLAVWKFPK